MPTQKPSIEDSLKSLTKIVETLEKGNLPLEKALAEFEKGIGIAKQCQTALDKAEIKIEKLIEKNGKTLLEDITDEFYDDEDD